MKHTFKALVLALSLSFAVPAMAQSSTDAFSTCLVDNLNGKERKNLAKWIFFAIGAHPELKLYSNANSKDIKASDEYLGALITRLLTVDCAARFQAAYAADPGSIQKAFEVVGKVAMQELMTNSDVQKATSNFAQYADTAKVNKLLSQK